jgi:hypothetical protein
MISPQTCAESTSSRSGRATGASIGTTRTPPLSRSRHPVLRRSSVQGAVNVAPIVTVLNTAAVVEQSEDGLVDRGKDGSSVLYKVEPGGDQQVVSRSSSSAYAIIEGSRRSNDEAGFPLSLSLSTTVLVVSSDWRCGWRTRQKTSRRHTERNIVGTLVAQALLSSEFLPWP